MAKRRRPHPLSKRWVRLLILPPALCAIPEIQVWRRKMERELDMALKREILAAQEKEKKDGRNADRRNDQPSPPAVPPV